MNTTPSSRLERRIRPGTLFLRPRLLAQTRCISASHLHLPRARPLITALPSPLFGRSRRVPQARRRPLREAARTSGPLPATAAQQQAPALHTHGRLRCISRQPMTTATAEDTTPTISAQAGWIGHCRLLATQAAPDRRASSWLRPWSTAGNEGGQVQGTQHMNCTATLAPEPDIIRLPIHVELRRGLILRGPDRSDQGHLWNPA